MERIWILGADDPEMQAIESLLRGQGETVAYATVDGVRVHAGNAYSADGCTAPGEYAHIRACGGCITLVECDLLDDRLGTRPETVAYTDCAALVQRIDHHRPGHPGYGRKPSEFLAASSIGQVVAEMARLGRLPCDWRKEPACDGDGQPGDFSYGTSRIGFRAWTRVLAMYAPIQEDDPTAGIWLALVPDTILYTAAADHCLAAAYAGRCPGVRPDDLMRWRVETRAAHQGRTVAEILADVERARDALMDADMIPGPYTDCGDPDHIGCDATEWVIRDMRGQTVPELPEAAARYGYTYLADAPPLPDGRRKIVLGGHAWPEIVAAFLRGEIAPELVDRYGDPERGFAGGYVP